MFFYAISNTSVAFIMAVASVPTVKSSSSTASRLIEDVMTTFEGSSTFTMALTAPLLISIIVPESLFRALNAKWPLPINTNVALMTAVTLKEKYMFFRKFKFYHTTYL